MTLRDCPTHNASAAIGCATCRKEELKELEAKGADAEIIAEVRGGPAAATQKRWQRPQRARLYNKQSSKQSKHNSAQTRFFSPPRLGSSSLVTQISSSLECISASGFAVSDMLTSSSCPCAACSAFSFPFVLLLTSRLMHT